VRPRYILLAVAKIVTNEFLGDVGLRREYPPQLKRRRPARRLSYYPPDRILLCIILCLHFLFDSACGSQVLNRSLFYILRDIVGEFHKTIDQSDPKGGAK